MNTNMFNEYYNYKIKTVLQYSILLSKIIGIDKNKLWHRKKNVEESLKWIIEENFKLAANSKNINLIRCFINDKDVFKYKIEKELQCVINYFIDHKRALEIKAYEKEIILAATIVHIANNLDIATSPYKVNKNNYKTILISYLEKFNKIGYFNLIDDGKKNTAMLIELIKTNVRKERRIFELLNSNISFNRYIDISEENKYYLAQYNYSVPSANEIDKEAIKYIYDKENFDDKFALISKDLIIVTLMKLFSIRKFRKIFFLPLKKEFYDNENNIKEIAEIYKDKYLSKYIKVLVNYHDIDDKLNDIFEKYQIIYYIYCSKNTSTNNQKVKGNNYLLSNDFNNLNQEYVKELLEDNKNIIIEDFDGLVTDKNLIEEGEEIINE